jgi:3-oxoacyl-[acyl-carrier protein] reductase
VDLGLTGKRVAAAASSSGLGFGIARALAVEGCRVGLASRRGERIEAAADALRRETGA